MDEIDRFWAKVEMGNIDDCWNWKGNISNHYGRFRFHDKVRQAQAVSWEIFYFPVPEGMQVLHKCDNTLCVNPKHLFIGTRSDNMQDMMNKGRKHSVKGENNGRAKLKSDDVRKIRQLYDWEDYNQSQLAKLYGVAPSTIHHIVIRDRWVHI